MIKPISLGISVHPFESLHFIVTHTVPRRLSGAASSTGSPLLREPASQHHDDRRLGPESATRGLIRPNTLLAEQAAGRKRRSGSWNSFRAGHQTGAKWLLARPLIKSKYMGPAAASTFSLVAAGTNASVGQNPTHLLCGWRDSWGAYLGLSVIAWDVPVSGDTPLLFYRSYGWTSFA